MTIYKTIDDIETLDVVAYNPFVINRDDLLDFDSKIAYIIKSNLFPSLRKSIKNNIPVDEIVVFSEEFLSDKEVQYLVQIYSGMKFYPFPRKDFYTSFLSNVTPSLADSVYTHLKATNRIIPIGSGQHKGFVINAKSFFGENLPDFSNSIPSFSELINDNKNLLDLFQHYAEESSFYENAIALRDQHIDYLYQEIESLKNQINSAYQTTWR